LVSESVQKKRRLKVIGKRKEITRTELLESLRNAKYDKLKLLEKTKAQEVQDYMRQNGQFTHDVIVVSHR
jgi:hypothetical protein